MTTRIISVVMIIILVVGIIAATRSRNHKITLSVDCNKAWQTWKQSVQKNQVIYVDGCFVPNPLTVKVGESVIFTDKNQKEMWIESDKNRDQLILPNFTSGQSWGEGQSYSYQFKKPGTYGYHNHVQPGDNGTIIVQ